jgi:hypothetical protein
MFDPLFKHGGFMKLLPFLFTILIAQSLLAQGTCSIYGRIYDIQNKYTLPDVNVIVRGTTTGTTSDSTGYFLLFLPQG